MVVWEHGFSEQNDVISLGVVWESAPKNVHQVRLLVDILPPKLNLFQIFPACPKCAQPFQVVISTGMSVLRLAFVHIDGDLYHSVLAPRLPQRVFLMNWLDGTRFYG